VEGLVCQLHSPKEKGNEATGTETSISLARKAEKKDRGKDISNNYGNFRQLPYSVTDEKQTAPT